MVSNVADRHDLDVVMLVENPKQIAADAPEAHQPYPYGHTRPSLCAWESPLSRGTLAATGADERAVAVIITGVADTCMCMPCSG